MNSSHPSAPSASGAVKPVRRRGLMVRVMQTYWRRTRGLTMGAQGIVLDGDNKVVLIRHTYRPGWHFPGGGVEKNETVQTALVRELEEEAGVIVTGEPVLFGIYANFVAFPCDHIALFVVRDWQRKPGFGPTYEIAEHGSFPFDCLPDETIQPVRRRLDELIGNEARSETW